MQAVLGFDLGVVVGGQIFEGTALGGGFVHIAEKIGGGKGELPVAGAEAEVLDLMDRTDAEQGIAALERVVEEAEWTPLHHRNQPQAQLRQLNCHRVDVNAVKAATGDEAAGYEHSLVLFAWQQFAASGLVKHIAVIGNGPTCLLLSIPCFNKPVAKVAAGLHQESTRTHRHVAHFQRQQLRRGFQLPFLSCIAFGWAIIYERLKCVLNDGFR